MTEPALAAIELSLSLPPIGNSRLPVNFDSSQSPSVAPSLPAKAARTLLDDAEVTVMEWVTGTVKSYNRSTGEGLIALDGKYEDVNVDLLSSSGLWLRKGQRVKCSRIHRPSGVFASCVRII